MEPNFSTRLVFSISNYMKLAKDKKYICEDCILFVNLF